jgi:hypothetical protein
MQATMTATPQVNANPSNNSPQPLNSAAPGPKDVATPSPPPQPATSGSGQPLNGVISTNGRIVTGTIPKLPKFDSGTGGDNWDSTPQVIARDY